MIIVFSCYSKQDVLKKCFENWATLFIDKYAGVNLFYMQIITVINFLKDKCE